MRLAFRNLVPLTALMAAACSGSTNQAGEDTAPDSFGLTPATESTNYGEPPSVPAGPLADDVAADLDLVFASLDHDVDLDALRRVAGSGDARVAWLFTDLLRLTQPGSSLNDTAFAGWQEVTGRTAVGPDSRWGNTTNAMLAWDTPAPPSYIKWKRQLFELIEPGWAPLFDDPDATIDWRWVSWGGVLIDDRPLDQTDVGCPEGCIPALNDPGLTEASGGDWYPDDRIVFGVVVDDVAVAFPKNIMEIHEMVNLTVSGRRVGIPYCTLCGSAQAYFTDAAADGVDPETPTMYELRTSGLLSRSNKVMYEFHTKSLFDTFTGEAVSGPLREAGVVLEQLTVRTATWGDWKTAHPETLIVDEDGGIGRTYDEDPLRGRDDNGPIFPIGDTDPRLPIQEPIVGVVGDDGTAIAFRASAAATALTGGANVELAGVRLRTDGAGFTAESATTGEPIAAHESFWFAWSQFHPDTEIWTTP